MQGVSHIIKILNGAWYPLRFVVGFKFYKYKI